MAVFCGFPENYMKMGKKKLDAIPALPAAEFRQKTAR